jgi:hypothetical protein
MIISLEPNSTPTVDLDSKLKSFLVNREQMLDLPTPEEPKIEEDEQYRQILFLHDNHKLTLTLYN